MSEDNGFDVRLAARFEQEHRHVPADAFVATAMKRILAARRHRDVLRISFRAATLVAIVAASPWLIAGVAHLNEAVEFSLTWATGLHGAWALGALAAVWVVATHLRRR
ncbi:MAG TPA: hypothetical protein VM146_01320 [Steroidobacteraceae bacterium]|nr:hypothetical protein [Steroidobacteraceae bacterium]